MPGGWRSFKPIFPCRHSEALAEDSAEVSDITESPTPGDLADLSIGE